MDYQLPDGSWHIEPRLMWGEAQAPGIDSVVFRHSLIADYGPAESMSYHRGNYDAGSLFDTDPGFLDPAGHNLRPAACSPLINAGLNAALPAGLTSDLDGTPRIRESIVDIGPYESNYTLKIDTVTATPTCAGIDSGAVSWSMQGGCPPLAFTWIHESGETGTTAAGLAPGLYRFHIADAAGRTDSFQIEIPGYQPSVALSGDTLLCPGETGGTLNASVSGGLEPVQYWWSGDTAAGPSAGDLPPGTYALTVVDALGCSDSATAQVTEVPAPQLDYALNHAGAPDIADGSILVAPSGGMPPFSLLWENGDTSALRTELLPGAYQLLLFDGAGCNYGYVFEVGVSPATEPGNDFEQPSLHPNPAAQQIELYWAGAEQFSLSDALGRIIIRVNGSAGENTVRIDALPEGPYYYEFRSNGRSIKRGPLLILH